MSPFDIVPDDELPKLLDEPTSPPSDEPGGFLDDVTLNTPKQANNDNDFLPSPSFEPTVERVVKKRVKMSKAMRKTMDGLKDKVADLPIMWFHDQAVEHPEWALDEKEETWLRESINSVFEVLDIDVEIQPISMQLTSIWWVLGYPFVTFLFLFLIKKGKTLQQEEMK